MKKTLASLVVLTGVAALQGCTAQPADEGPVQSTEQALSLCNSQNGFNPMAAALAVAIATEIGQIDVLRDFNAVSTQFTFPGNNVQTGRKLVRVTTKCVQNGCANVDAILALQDPTINCLYGFTRGCINAMTFNAWNFANALAGMYADQVNTENNLKLNNVAEYNELAAGHKLVSSSAFTPAPTADCGKHFFFKATKKDGTALAHPAYIKDRLVAFGGTNNQFLAFSSSTTEGKIAIDPDDTSNTGSTCHGSCATYTLDKVYDPTGSIRAATPCCTMTATLAVGMLQQGIGVAAKWSFCYPN
jgi:hypothetical protein